MRRTTAITVACMTAAALTVSACGRSADNGGTAGQTGAAVSSGKATGTITVWAMGAEGDNLSKLTKDFEAANPGVKVQVTAIPWSAAHDKFTTAITAGKTPDVAMVGTTWMGEFSSSDALDRRARPDRQVRLLRRRPEDDRGERHLLRHPVVRRDPRRLLPLRPGQEGRLRVRPHGLEGPARHGQGHAGQGGAKWGIGLQAGGEGSWQSVMPFAWSEGADLTKNGGKSYNFDSPQLLKATQYYQSFFTDGISDKSAPATPTDRARLRQRPGPDVHLGPWEMSAVEKVGGAGFKDKYNVAPIPAGSAGSSSFVGGSNFVVFKNTKNRDTAWKFVSWLATRRSSRSGTPSRPTSPRSRAPGRTPALSSDKKLAVFGKQLETAKAPPSFPTWEQAVKALDTEMEKITKTGEDPAAGLKTAQQQAESIGTGL